MVEHIGDRGQVGGGGAYRDGWRGTLNKLWNGDEQNVDSLMFAPIKFKVPRGGSSMA